MCSFDDDTDKLLIPCIRCAVPTTFHALNHELLLTMRSHVCDTIATCHRDCRRIFQSDFLRYIEYELNLEQLRKIRKRSSPQEKPTFGDRSIVQHLHFIFQRATKRFPGDIAIWVQYLDFCEHTKSTKQFSKTVSRVLQLHPREEGLWIRAASKQWEINHDMKTARKLLQQVCLDRECHTINSGGVVSSGTKHHQIWYILWTWLGLTGTSSQQEKQEAVPGILPP